jgi:hypothetical protein
MIPYKIIISLILLNIIKNNSIDITPSINCYNNSIKNSLKKIKLKNFQN